MNSSELKLKNSQRRQQAIEVLSKAPTYHERQTLILAAALAEHGQLVSEQICELREAVDRLTNSLSANSLPKQPEPKHEVEP